MPHYFFHLFECGDVTPDEEGVDLSGADEARARAIECAREIMAAEVRGGRICLSCEIKVHDAAGALVLRVPFRDAVLVHGTC